MTDDDATRSTGEIGRDDATSSGTDEAELLDALRQALDAVDAPPAHVLEAARGAFAWRTVDVELAELVYDSATTEMPTAVRSAGAARQVTFRAPGMEIEVEVTSERTRVVIGQLVPAQQATVDLHHGGGEATATTDALGRFFFGDVKAGPIKLSVVTPTGAVVQTEGLVV